MVVTRLPIPWPPPRLPKLLQQMRSNHVATAEQVRLVGTEILVGPVMRVPDFFLVITKRHASTRSQETNYLKSNRKFPSHDGSGAARERGPARFGAPRPDK